MILSQFSFRRRVFVKRVASVLSVSVAVSLAACSSHGIPFSDSGEQHHRYRKTGSILIPPEPVYGYADSSTTESSSNKASFKQASYVASYQEPTIQRTALAPVHKASYDGSFTGSSFAMQPVDAHETSSSRHVAAAKDIKPKRYAQAETAYYGRGSSGYRSSYSDYKPYYKPHTRRHHSSYPSEHH